MGVAGTCMTCFCAAHDFPRVFWHACTYLKCRAENANTYLALVKMYILKLLTEQHICKFRWVCTQSVF
jgi:hypothetical protein